MLCDRINSGLADIIRTRLTATLRLVPQALLRSAAALPGVGNLDADPARLAGWQRLGLLALSERGCWRKVLSARYREPGTRNPRRALRCATAFPIYLASPA